MSEGLTSSRLDRVSRHEILAQQVRLEVSHLGFDGKERVGEIVVHKDVQDCVGVFFELAKHLDFRIWKVATADKYGWDDNKLMGKNVSHGFNYRIIAGTNVLSPHSYGYAFDINPWQNPYIRYENGQEIVAPTGAVWNPDALGTLYTDHPLVIAMKSRGWEWGGDWIPESGRTDYQHFEFPMKEANPVSVISLPTQ